ncbi:hypothetical protein EVAR_30583_1 [Eumeta japonica]|uniref:Uncharacterized protein n=1 Tax=Eumeta variegata TaxID=151549 RepID=A0A4C1VRT3_EUMVA|nr:hypothetical protein EVAR_30583_1 [Eumeta japonica]
MGAASYTTGVTLSARERSRAVDLGAGERDTKGLIRTRKEMCSCITCCPVEKPEEEKRPTASILLIIKDAENTRERGGAERVLAKPLRLSGG